MYLTTNDTSGEMNLNENIGQIKYISKNECYGMATEVKQSNVSYNK